MEAPKTPDGWPEHMKLFRSARDYLDIARGAGWLVMDKISQLIGMQNETPSEHFRYHAPPVRDVECEGSVMPAQIDRNFDSEGTPVEFEEQADEWREISG